MATGLVFTVRGKRVILDSDLAALYGVETKRLNEKVRRNPRRFPKDFCFLLTSEEWEAVRRGRRRKYLPYVFTAHGALMASGVINSKRAVEVSKYIVRTLALMSPPPEGLPIGFPIRNGDD